MGGLVLRPFGPVPLGRFSMSKNRLQSKAKQTNTTTAKDIFLIVFLSYRDMIKNPKRQTIFAYIYKVCKFFAKK